MEAEAVVFIVLGVTVVLIGIIIICLVTNKKTVFTLNVEKTDPEIGQPVNRLSGSVTSDNNYQANTYNIHQPVTNQGAQVYPALPTPNPPTMYLVSQPQQQQVVYVQNAPDMQPAAPLVMTQVLPTPPPEQVYYTQTYISQPQPQQIIYSQPQPTQLVIVESQQTVTAPPSQPVLTSYKSAYRLKILRQGAKQLQKVKKSCIIITSQGIITNPTC